MSETRAQEMAGQTGFYGKYRGVVTDNADPNQRGRIKAAVPAVLGDLDTGWALPCLPYAGNGSGLHLVPEPGVGVWIEFEGGDLDYPIWSGCWWGDGHVPAEETGKPGRPPLKLLRSEQGLIVALDDDDQTATLSDSSGSNIVTIRVKEGEVRIQAVAKVVVDAPAIELTDRAPHPVAYGDALLQYLNQLVTVFNAHLHKDQTLLGMIPITPAPPVVPFPPATPTLHSSRVTTG